MMSDDPESRKGMTFCSPNEYPKENLESRAPSGSTTFTRPVMRC